MKNVIFIVLDSFIYDKLNNNTYGVTPTPFINELIKKSTICTNLYSQGPFTEAGNKALLTGSDSLNNGGYMHNLNDSTDIYLDVFKRNNYEIYDFFSPSYMYSNKDLKNIDHQYFTHDFIFESVYGNRLDYFAKLKKERNLYEDEYDDVIRQLDLTFQAWSNYFDNSNEDKYRCIIRIVRDFNFAEAQKCLFEEKKQFDSDKRKYADKVLDEGRKHSIYDIPNCKYDNYLDVNFIKEYVYKKNVFFFRKSCIKQFVGNLMNQKFNIRKLLSSLFLSIKTFKLIGYMKSVVFNLFCWKLLYAFKPGFFFQLLPSIRHCFDVMVEELSNRKGDKPFFVHLHAEELHNRASFFTYDLSNKDYIEEEFSIYKNYLNSLNKNWKGQLLYDYALLYIDLSVKKLFEKLEKKGLLENTIIAITSDHGCSYDCIPLRDNFVNNHHTENYHIPLIIYDHKSPKQRVIDSYHTSKDVLPTIYQLCGISKPNGINGKSILDEDNQGEYAISEYMGGGCPDMRLRPIQFMIRNKKYLVCYSVKMNELFENGVLEEVYDLLVDPMELHNIKNNEGVLDEIKPLLQILKLRHIEIKSSFYDYYK